MATVKCNRCGEPIKNVLDWLLEGTEDIWQCRNCFGEKPDGTKILVASPMLSEVLGDQDPVQ